MRKKQIKYFLFGLIKEKPGFSAINIHDTSYMTTGDSKKELIENILDIISIMEGENHKIYPESDFSPYCCYWLIKYTGNNAQIIKEIENLDEAKKSYNSYTSMHQIDA